MTDLARSAGQPLSNPPGSPPCQRREAVFIERGATMRHEKLLEIPSVGGVAAGRQPGWASVNPQPPQRRWRLPLPGEGIFIAVVPHHGMRNLFEIKRDTRSKLPGLVL